jgi:hypothetical protein
VYCVGRMVAAQCIQGINDCGEQDAAVFTFTALHTIDEREAQTMNLLTSLVEKRKPRASVYCTCKYFDFVCLVASIFVANLMLKMIRAYNDEDTVTSRKTNILQYKQTMNQFSCLSGINNDNDNKLLLAFIH